MVEKIPQHSRVRVKRDMSKCVDTLTKVAKSLIETKKEATPCVAHYEHIMTAIDILNRRNALMWLAPSR